ncbi:MAG TPA: isoleucine--tRNA ligase [Gemmatimonadaceae bacterium]|jgi:isoleucyl-tRNA synthetase|nr:isoleucine--tRNA ligase [Gemmatimonadaceae bacterium]
MSTSLASRYQLLPADRPADEVERELLARWNAEGLFQQTLAAREGAPSFVFFEGPPTANGRPGIHHVFSRTIKDLFCRHRAMKGFRVSRKAGWDTHGLPVEIEVEKQLGISGKQQIEALGVAEFNRKCRDSVFTYRADWEQLSARMAYWLDYDHPYVTYTNDYVESVWWALKTLYDKNLLYRGHKILPYCPRCGTALSSHEVAQGYEDVSDPSVYIALELTRTSSASGAESSEPPAARRILVWTTTPWTLVSNTALAVHPDLEYVEVVRREEDKDQRTLILAASRLHAVLGDDFADRWTIVHRMQGASLVGMTYRRPLDWVEYPGATNHEIIVGEEFVSADDGSGVVHMSPAFGADDYAAGRRHNLAFLQPVDARGQFPASMPLVGGLFVKDADALLIEELKRRGVLWRSGQITHPYPHCWRCGTPLLYYARTSWFVRTTAFREEMLARNARVDWHPPSIGDGRFGEWLKNNIDWAISRDRYWGTPLPIWICDAESSHVEAIGGFAELAERGGQSDGLPRDFDPHKPHVDGYHWRCGVAGCAGTMRRAPEVIDTWFDSGSMPFAQWHYPFENREKVADQFPADFIAEGVDQTRGWFYSLLAIATGLGDALPNNSDPGAVRDGYDASGRAASVAAPYRAVVVNDQVLDASGLKMSKSRGNIVDPWTVIGRHGVDAVRLFFLASSQVWVPRAFDENVLGEQAERFLRTLKNVYSGIFAQYANFGWSPSDRDPPLESRPVIDRWMISRLTHVERTVDGALQAFDATTAARAIIELVDDDVSNWYVRLNRARFYDVDTDDGRAAFATLFEVLVSVCRLLAPIAPFVSDWIHRELTGESVHLAPYAPPRDGSVDVELDAAMEAIRKLSRLGRAAREEVGIRVRQPLSRLICVAPGVTERALEPLMSLLAAELNVKEVRLAASGDALVTLEAKANFRALGKKFGSNTPLAAKAVAAIGSEHLAAFVRGEPLVISVGGESHSLEPGDVTILRRATGSFAVQEDGGFLAAIDPSLTPELISEGRARELVSRVQRMRKERGFAVSDRIILTVAGNEPVAAMVRAHRGWIASEVLASELVLHADGDADNEMERGLDGSVMHTVDLDGTTAHVGITRLE